MKRKISVVLLMFLVAISLLVFNKTLHQIPEVLKTQTYIVTHGDTIWEIADKYIDETIDIRKYIELIYKYNDGMSADINEGQAITIPILVKDGYQ